MPELPEIETIKHVIEPQITGLAIEKATVLRPEVIAHPARVVKQRFDSELTAILQALCWWDLPEPELTDILPLLCEQDLALAKQQLAQKLAARQAAQQP